MAGSLIALIVSLVVFLILGVYKPGKSIFD